MHRLETVLYSQVTHKREPILCRWKGDPPCLALPPNFALSFQKSFCSTRAAKCDVKQPPIAPFSDANWFYCFMSIPSLDTMRRGNGWGFLGIKSDGGASVGPLVSSQLPMFRDAAARLISPPLDHALVKAVACEQVAQTQQPLSRQSLADVTRRVQAALGKPMSRSTVWRILASDAIKPWQYRYWIFPRDPRFAEKAGPILDLYAGTWQGKELGPSDCILSADEKTSIQARLRCHDSLSPEPGKPARIESEYERGGALQYLAAWDVRRGVVMGRCEARTGIQPFSRLVEQVLSQEPYRSANRLFWIVDNGSSHRGETAKRRMRQLDARNIVVHTPIHASWLNQVEIYFSIIQRKVLTPNDFNDLEAVRLRLALYEELSNHTPRPFRWKFDKDQLTVLLEKIETRERVLKNGQLH